MYPATTAASPLLSTSRHPQHTHHILGGVRLFAQQVLSGHLPDPLLVSVDQHPTWQGFELRSVAADRGTGECAWAGGTGCIPGPRSGG